MLINCKSCFLVFDRTFKYPFSVGKELPGSCPFKFLVEHDIENLHHSFYLILSLMPTEQQSLVINHCPITSYCFITTIEESQKLERYHEEVQRI